MGSGSLSPILAKSSPETSIIDSTRTTKSSPPSADTATTDIDALSLNNRTGQHRHHRTEPEDRSLSPARRQSSRYDGRYERRKDDRTIGYPQDRHYTREPPMRRDYWDDDQRSKNSRNNRNNSDTYRPAPFTTSETSISGPSSRLHGGDSYRPTPPSESVSGSSSSRHSPRYEMGRDRVDYPSVYDRHHQYHHHRHQSPYPSFDRQQQRHHPYHRRERPLYSHHTRQPSHHHHHQHHHHESYDDRHYQPYNPRPRTARRTVERGTEEERQKSTTIFTGNLPYNYLERDVAAMFERYGKLVKITIPIDNVTTRNKGFAFVEFEHRHEAQEAFDNFQGFSVDGRRLKLDWDIGLNKKDTRRTSRLEDHRHTSSHGIRSPSSSSPPLRIGRETDTYIPSHNQV